MIRERTLNAGVGEFLERSIRHGIAIAALGLFLRSVNDMEERRHAQGLYVLSFIYGFQLRIINDLLLSRRGCL